MIASLALLLAVATPAPQNLPKIALHTPKATLQLQVAKSEQERELGLMSVTKLAPRTGMVFVFDQDQPVEFWMKDTLVPLDMVFVGADGRVRTVAAKVPVVPLEESDENIPRRNGVAKYVLELPSGEASKDGIAPGVTLALPTAIQTLETPNRPVAQVSGLVTPAPQKLAKVAIQAPKATLHLQVASTDQQRERGLMSVKTLAPHTGMVFVLENDQQIEFWMKGMLVPIDMVFVGADGRVRSVADNVPAVPLDTPDQQIPRRTGIAKYVLQLPAGEAAADGIAPGVKLPLPTSGVFDKTNPHSLVTHLDESAPRVL